MKKFILSIGLTSFTLASFAQFPSLDPPCRPAGLAPNTSHIATHGPTEIISLSPSIANTEGGMIDAKTFILPHSRPSGDAYIVRLTTDGQIDFKKVYTFQNQTVFATSAKYIPATANTPEGYVVAGRTTYNPFPGNNGTYVPFMIRTDVNGKIINARVFDAPVYDEYNFNVCVAIDDQKNIHGLAVVGNSDERHVLVLSTDQFLAAPKINNVQIGSTVGGTFFNRPYASMLQVISIEDGGFMACGATGHNYDMMGVWLLRYDAAGNFQWHQEFKINTPTNVYDLTSGNNADHSYVLPQSLARIDEYIYVVGQANDAEYHNLGPTFRDGFVLQLKYPNNALNTPTSYQSSYLFDDQNKYTEFRRVVENNAAGVTGRAGELCIAALQFSDMNPVILTVDVASATITSQLIPNQSSGTANGPYNDYFVSTLFATNQGIYSEGLHADWTNNTGELYEFYLSDDPNNYTCKTDPSLVMTSTTFSGLNLDVNIAVTTVVDDFPLAESSECPKVPVDCAIPGVGGGGTDRIISSTSETTARGANTTRVSPNPVSDMLQVDIQAEQAGAVQVYITDILGREEMLVFNGNLSKGNNQQNLSVTALKPGIYLLKVVFDNEVRVLRISKQ